MKIKTQNRLFFVPSAIFFFLASYPSPGQGQEPTSVGGLGQGESSQTEPRQSHLSPGNDRVMTMPSTGLLPKETWSFSAYEFGLLHLSYGATEAIQVSCFMLLPVFQFGIGPSVKWRFFKEERWRLALLAFGGLEYWFAAKNWQAYFGGVGLIADYCLDGGCDSFVSFNFQPHVSYFNFHLGYDGHSKGFSSFGFLSSVGLVGALSKGVSLLAELRYFFSAPFDEVEDNGSLFMINYGVRIHGSEFAADIGFIRPILALTGSEPHSVEEVMQYLPLGYPWLSFTYQW